MSYLITPTVTAADGQTHTLPTIEFYDAVTASLAMDGLRTQVALFEGPDGSVQFDIAEL